MSGSGGGDVGPESPVWYFDLSPLQARASALLDDSAEPIPVAEERRLRPGQCPCLHGVVRWFVSAEGPAKLSWRRSWSDICAGAPGTRPDCGECPAYEPPAAA